MPVETFERENELESRKRSKDNKLKARNRRSRATGTPGPHCRSGILQATGAKVSVQREAAYGDVHGKPIATLPRVALSMDLLRRR